MINEKHEIRALWEKYKDVETDEEWGMLVDELVKFRDPAWRQVVVRCLIAIEARYLERMKEAHHQC